MQFWSGLTVCLCWEAVWQAAQRADMANRSRSTRWILWQVEQDIAGLFR
jgi:hypothetical protein